MNKPTNATEMREPLLDYIDALLLGGIPKAEFDAPKEEPDIEKAAAELAELAKKLERLRGCIPTGHTTGQVWTNVAYVVTMTKRDGI